MEKDFFGAVWQKDGYTLRPARRADAAAYLAGFLPVDAESARLTGCRTDFKPEEVERYFLACTDDPSRYDFLLIGPSGRVAGECVLNELDAPTRCANFRIGIFRPDDRGRGLGQWMTRAVCGFAFDTLGLHRVSLDVYGFNERAAHVYEKAGFRREGVLRAAVKTETGWADDILMAMLEEDWAGRLSAPTQKTQELC